MPQQSKLLLPIIIFSQFAGTSLWFAGNAIIDKVQSGATESHANITSVVQFGFIAGTLLFALLTIADRYSSKKVFFASATIASIANLLIILLYQSDFSLFLLRFITGFFLAGIYPVGMKIAADLFPQKLGKALGFLVGALVLGTSFPHLVRSQSEGLSWEVVIITTSVLAFAGGCLVLLLIPSNKKTSTAGKPDLLAAAMVFKSKNFRAAAFGYFGHMWELYAFWAILPLLFAYYNSRQNQNFNIYWWSFLVIAAGALGCIAGGFVSQKWGSKAVAFCSLLISGLCCLLLPFVVQLAPILFLLFLLIWGAAVVSDSPQFSALVARNAANEHKGTALTIVTSIGFAITIISIQVLKPLFETYHEKSLWILAIGPLAGLFFFRSLKA